VEGVGVACLLEVEVDHEVETEDVETEVGLVEAVANQEEVHREVVVAAAVVEDSCLDKVPDDVAVVVEVGTALHPAREVASFLVEEVLLEVVALESWAPSDPFLVPCCLAAEVAVVVVAVVVADLMWEAWEAAVVGQPSVVEVVVVACLVVQEVMVDALDDAWAVGVMVVEECLVALPLEEAAYWTVVELEEVGEGACQEWVEEEEPYQAWPQGVGGELM
jgi:hypothetical protein